MGEVTHLWRFAVKGLDRDEFPQVQLCAGLGFPNDRRWALQLQPLPQPSDNPELPAPTPFDPIAPAWMHKQCFLCAYTAGEALGALETSYDDDADCLTVRRRCNGDLLLRAPLAGGNAADRNRVESFFSSLPSDMCSGDTAPGALSHSGEGIRRDVRVRLVESAVGMHHFGNTSVGFKSVKRPDGSASGCVVHIVNAETVRELSAAAGLEESDASATATAGCSVREHAKRGEGPLAPSRFRPNIVLAGLPPWSEFDWVGKRVRIGAVTFEVLSRTVRCEATNVDARAGSGRVVHDVPQLLQQHFPRHGPYLGVYARVVEGGSLRVGDTVAGVEAEPLLAHRGASRLWVFALVLGTLCMPLFAMWLNGFKVQASLGDGGGNSTYSGV